ncbi:hypothetical protein BWQ96_02689 [Gracilariopsis chorda]|uniref:Sulfotransferase domain-containing protein n=1 Tax=Gracilariopsis chorda TaxID=448386 RepID=A0A2V3IZP3_9FLOR|nr:hypothetical protein BWQ96_02689 [Gracilariopsis chorda]|eukprot:PXF47545.1 hypothetical protein BWQ96_02689 [Gracilariopsis chorda]
MSVPRKKFQQSRYFKDVVVQSMCVAVLTVFGLYALNLAVPTADNGALSVINESASRPLLSSGAHSPHTKRLLFYNRPPKTGSTSVRIAMKNALNKDNMVAAKCFNMIEWNEMALRTIINRRNVDFYGCHTRLVPDRFRDISQMRGGNVTFMTSTREASDIVLSAYLQDQRDRRVADITGKKEMDEEIARYKKFVEKYPVDALYAYHGAGDIHKLSSCPVSWQHTLAMRRIAERYEIVVDLEKADESAVMVEAVTGLKPDLNLFYNERTKQKSPMLDKLGAIDTSHKTCGNELVHEVLTMQFNVIKDRLMQNRCFDEGSASAHLCDRIKLTADSIAERGRLESMKARDALKKLQPKEP